MGLVRRCIDERLCLIFTETRAKDVETACVVVY